MTWAQKLEIFTHRFTKGAGSARGFLFALLSITIWLAAGWICEFSHIWESALSLYIGVGTFLMVFLIQRSQTKELMILHIKLNELLSATKHINMRRMNGED